jgi:enterochelin esterase family protein
MFTDPLLERARKEGNPLINSDTATFIWQGKTAPKLIEDLHGWEESPQEMERISPGLWAATLTLPRDAYLEYAFLDPKTGQRILDPLNPQRVWNGISNNNHFFYMPDAAPTPLVRPGKGIARGTVSRHEVQTEMLTASRRRTVYLYKPPTEEPVPLVVVYDGIDYLRRGKLAVILDNLIAQKRIRPLALAMLQNGGQARFVEYGCSDITLAFLVETILPLARQNLKLADIKKHPGAYGVLGASMGGVMALYTGLRLPEMFGKVLSQSGAFTLWERPSVAVDLVQHAPHPEMDIWMDVGRLEWLLEDNRKMRALLKGKGYRVTYREVNGAHNFTSWRDDVWRGLEALFGQ